MKKLFPLFTFLLCFAAMAQHNKPIAQEILRLEQNKKAFKTFPVLEINSEVDASIYRNTATDANVLKLNKRALASLLYKKPQTITISVPYENNNVEVKLYKAEILTDDFAAKNQAEETINYAPGIYYRGIVANKTNTLVAFSFFEDNLYGIISTPRKGNLVVAKVKNSTDFLSYTEANLTGENPFNCGVDAMPENQDVTLENSLTAAKQSNNQDKCVRVYYEVAYAPYLNNNADEVATLNWLTAVHNNIATLYENDNVNTALSEVLIWTEDDPYDFNFSENLNFFSNYRTGFNGDLGHLVNSPSTTSVAYLNSLCGAYRYAYSGISQYYQNVPTYSWTIMAMTHEMGHALGSPHTHACAWNGDNTAIDGCGPQSGNDEGCDAPLPTNGGTIMSYCHLVGSVGINFNNGFGSQPATRIQNTINGKACLGTDCVNSCVASIENLEITNIGTTTADFSIVDNISTNWEYRVRPFNSFVGNWISTSSTSVSIDQLAPNSYYVIEASNICNTGSFQGSSIQKVFLTNGDYCGNDTFVDTGGTNSIYGNNQEFSKTFYPEDPNEEVSLEFTALDLENGYDFLYVYDGEDTEAPLFTNGELTGSTLPNTFIASNPAGAITVKFVSDPYVNGQGWEATISCGNLSTDAVNALRNLKAYPNPTTGRINIESPTSIKAIAVYDLLGRKVKSFQNLGESTSQNIDLSALSTGGYFLQVTAENGATKTLKVIKE